MNELIEKIYDQAIVLEDGGDYVSGELDPVKFARLIVAECAQAVFDTELDDCCSDSDVICAVSFHLKKHFGVEQ